MPQINTANTARLEHSILFLAPPKWKYIFYKFSKFYWQDNRMIGWWVCASATFCLLAIGAILPKAGKRKATPKSRWKALQKSNYLADIKPDTLTDSRWSHRNVKELVNQGKKGWTTWQWRPRYWQVVKTDCKYPGLVMSLWTSCNVSVNVC